MKIVRDSILNERTKLALASGLIIIQDNKILLIKPKGSKKRGSYSIPKGHVDQGESLLAAAKRETEEETGLDIKNLIIKNPDQQKFIDYTDGDMVHKRVYYYQAYPKNKIKSNHFKIQKKEVEWAGFLSKEEALPRISKKFRPFLKLLK